MAPKRRMSDSYMPSSKYQRPSVRFYRYRPSRYARRPPYRAYVPRTLGNPLSLVERKYFDLEYSAAIVVVTTDWTATVADPASASLFSPAIGTEYFTRIGRKVQLLSLKLRATITCAAQTNQTASDGASCVRCLLVQDKQTNGVQATGNLVIASASNSGAINMFQNPRNFGRFKVLKDKRWVLQSPTLTYDGANVEQSGLEQDFEWIIKFKKPVVVNFNTSGSSGGGIGDIVDHSFHVYAATNSTALVPTLNYKVRCVFVDV